MIRDFIVGNENVRVNSREVALLKEHFEQVATRELQAKSRKDMRTAVSEKVSGEGGDTGGGGDDQTE